MDYFKDYCSVCPKHVNCCIFKDKAGFAFTGIKNAKIIRKTIKKDYSYFLEYRKFPKKLLSTLKHEDPSLEGALRYSELNNNMLLVLKTQKNGRCIFLDNVGKCQIYDIRPNICRIFPYWAIKLDSGKIKVVPHDNNPRCGIIKPIAKKDIEKTLSKKEILEIKKVFNNIIKEDEFYKKNVKKFVDSKGKFLQD